MEKKAIPTQRKGAHFDVQQTRNVEDRETAKIQYERVKARLLDVRHWGDYAQEPADTFVLADALGNIVQRPAQEGDYIKVHLPGPHSTTGDGGDWVRIENIIEERNKMLDEIFTAMTIRPCPNPHLNSHTIAHFYDDRSTNTLLVCRHKIELMVSIHGRNELVNSDTNWLDYLRNLLIALPAKAGLSNPHWLQLAKGLIDL